MTKLPYASTGGFCPGLSTVKCGEPGALKSRVGGAGRPVSENRNAPTANTIRVTHCLDITAPRRSLNSFAPRRLLGCSPRRRSLPPDSTACISAPQSRPDEPTEIAGAGATRLHGGRGRAEPLQQSESFSSKLRIVKCPMVGGCSSSCASLAAAIRSCRQDATDRRLRPLSSSLLVEMPNEPTQPAVAASPQRRLPGCLRTARR